MTTNPGNSILALTYTSRAVAAFTPESLVALLARAREHNLSTAITGLLIFRDGRFLQVLEGEEHHVRALMRRIEADCRHKDVVIHAEERRAHRIFGEWSMGFELVLSNQRRFKGRSAWLYEPDWALYLATCPSQGARLALDFAGMDAPRPRPQIELAPRDAGKSRSMHPG